MFSPRVYHRDFFRATIKKCPDSSLVGRSFSDIAQDKGIHEVDDFLDLVATHGKKLRWYSKIGNDRTKPLEHTVSHPSVLIGFSDAGAHLRNMAFYNFPLRLLKLIRDAQKRGEEFMSIEQAIYRLTVEIGSWF